MLASRSLLPVSLWFSALLPLCSCGDGLAAGAAGAPSGADDAGATHAGSAEDEDATGSQPPADPKNDWVQEATVSLRNRLTVPSPAARLNAAEIVAQLKRYDPGRMLRCEVEDDPAYRGVVDGLGGVTWGYAVQHLEDLSQPLFRLGPPEPVVLAPTTGANDGAGSAPVPVEIAEADIVGLSETAALFYSKSHGLMLVDLTQPKPHFTCAVKLPGQVKNFYYYRDHLIVLLNRNALHFALDQGNLRFIEQVALSGELLDTRRFNDKLVVYTRFVLEQAAPAVPTTQPTGPLGPINQPSPVYQPPSQHRALQVFKLGDQLVEELSESLINTTVDPAYLESGAVSEDTLPGDVVHTASSFGDVLWASDHYFVVTEMLDVTKLSAWATRTYRQCTESHTVETPYRHCYTRYETRPNPNYTPPDNPSGDRACKGITLSECLRSVARVSNPTIEVPVETLCEERVYSRWVCDTYVSRSYQYPQLTTESATRLSIYEYTPEGFVRLDGKVHEIVTPALDGVPLDGYVDKLTTSSEAYDLSIPGHLQTLQFQNGFLYAIASGVLQVYSMAENSLVRTSELTVANESLQSSLFSPERLYLSDFGFANGMDHSVLRVIDLTNPGFPKQVSVDYALPGGHSSILATQQGILTIGSVLNFENTTRNAVKLGLFVDPFTTEKAYLILATELASVFLSDTKAHYFDAQNSRLFLPYTGYDRSEPARSVARLGASHLLDDEIVSDGALDMPEPIERVRPRPAQGEELLGFGQNSVVWLRPTEGALQSDAVLAYYTPIALYRLSDQDDYLEVSRLGTRCKLHFAASDTLNASDAPKESEAFECGGQAPIAYGRNILFSPSYGVGFDDDGNVSVLEAERVQELITRSQQRAVCLYSETPTSAAIDFDHLPSDDELECYSADEYQKLVGSTYATAGGAFGSGGALAPGGASAP